MEPIKIALVGCGGIMGAHADGIYALWEKGLKLYDIVAVCDTVEERASNLSGRLTKIQDHAPAVFTNVHEMLEKVPEIEAVDICTLHSEHHTVALPCLQAGKHVMIEKPLGISMRAARMIMDEALKSQRVLVTAENYRFSPGERARRWAVKTGRIGQPRSFFWLDVGESLGKWGWRNFKHLAGGGWVLDGGVHYADLFRYHLGTEAREVFALTRQSEPYRYEDTKQRKEAYEVTVEDASYGLISFDNDVVVQWTTVHTAPGSGIGRNVLYGSEGSIDWEAGLTLRDGTTVDNETLVEDFMGSLSEDEKESFFPAGVTDTFAIELKDFADAVRLGKVPEMNGMEGYKDLAICMALFESAWHGRPVTIQEIERCELEGYQRDLNAAL